MPVYNAERFVREAIESILAQTYADFELIIINDGSTDRSEEIIRSFSDSRIHLISQSNAGVIGALNAGLKVARGIYIARMDADDISESTRLEKQVNFLKGNPDIALCGTWATTIDEKGVEIGKYEYPPINHTSIRQIMVRRNPFIHPSIMFTKKAIESVGIYDPRYKHAEDYELWTRMAARSKTANIPERLLRYRILEGSITRRNWGAMIRKAIRVRTLAIMRIWLKIPI